MKTKVTYLFITLCFAGENIMAVLEKKKGSAKNGSAIVFESKHFVVTTTDGGASLLIKGVKSGGEAKLTILVPDHLTVSAPETQEVSRKGPTTGIEVEGRLFIKPRPDKK